MFIKTRAPWLGILSLAISPLGLGGCTNEDGAFDGQTDARAPGGDTDGGAPDAGSGESTECEPLPDPPGETVVDLGDEGLEEGDLIDPYLEEWLDDGVEVRIPEGRYLWEGEGDGSFDDASIVGEGEVIFDAGDGYTFGTTWHTATEFELRNITVEGVADHENDKFRFAATEPDAVMTVRNFHLPDGAESGDGGGRVGIRVNPEHAGEIYFIDLRVSRFPNNALYADNPGEEGGAGGAVHVRGGYFRNNNITAVRIGSDESSVIGTVIVNDDLAPDDGGRNQRGIRVREEGKDILIEDVDIVQSVSANAAIEIHRESGESSGTIRNVRIQNDIDSPPISVDSGTFTGSDIHITGSGELTPEGGDFETCTGAECDPPDLEPEPTCR